MTRRRVRRSTAWSLAAIALLSCAGCGAGGASDLDLAREVLATALEAWKSGAVPRDLRQQQPEIVVGDNDWERGRRLFDYEIAANDVFDGKNLRMPVKLTMQRPYTSGQVAVNVTYVVCVHPAITVFREE